MLPAVAGGPYQDISEESYRTEENRLRAMIQRDPQNAKAYLQLADLFKSEAAVAYNYTPDYSGYNYTAAIQVYREAIAAVPPNADIHFNLGAALYDSQMDNNVARIKARQDEGIGHIRKAIELDPKNDEYHMKLGDILKERGESRGAIAAYKTAVSLELKPEPESILSFNRAMGYQLISDYLKEQGELSAATAARNKSDAMFCKIYRNCPSLIKNKTVDTTPNQIQQKRSASSASALQQGNRLANAGKYGEAIQAYTIAVEQSSSQSQQIQARLARSRAYVLATVYGSPGYDNYDQAVGAAIADCSRVISLQPNNPAGYACRGFAYSYIFSNKEAFADFSRAIELAPKDPNLYFERGYAYYRNNQTDPAIADFSQAIKLNPQFADAYYFRGLNYTYKKPVDVLGANLDFSQAIQLDPTQVRYYDSRGRLRNDSKNYQGAIADYTKVIQLAPSANVYSDRGFAWAALGKENEAMADYNQAISLAPQHLTAYYRRGLVRAKRGDKKGALSDLRRAQRNYQEIMGAGNFDKPEYQRILKAIEQLHRNEI